MNVETFTTKRQSFLKSDNAQCGPRYKETETDTLMWECKLLEHLYRASRQYIAFNPEILLGQSSLMWMDRWLCTDMFIT